MSKPANAKPVNGMPANANAAHSMPNSMPAIFPAPLPFMNDALIEWRKALIPFGKAWLEQERKAAEIILNDVGGLACAQHISKAQDHLIQELYALIKAKLGTSNKSEPLSLIAVGGYGRGTLAPGSDIDLLFLLPSHSDATHKIAETMLYCLWDLGLKVGHSSRTVEECISNARDDLTVKTALLEPQFICGDAVLYKKFVADFDRDIVQGHAAEFVAAKLSEREMRIQKAGTSRYLVEPNVKEGKGGFRDLQTLYWMAKFTYRVESKEELVKAGLFTAGELVLFQRCEEFLWKVRCHMHFTTGRAEERLSFDLQRSIAARLNYKKSGALSPVERFMKHYFLVAKDVGDLTAIVCAALEARETKPRAVLSRVMNQLRRRRSAIKNKDFMLEHGRLTVANDQIFTRDPVNLLRLFALADEHQLAIHPAASRLVTLSLKLIDNDLRENKEANRLFLALLTSRHAPESILRKMHETGVLGRFIPDFGRINAMMQFSMYHHYTVDEHTLRAIGILAEIDAGHLGKEHPVSHDLMTSLNNRTALYVALFLHDIGKGRVEAHELVGARIAEVLCPRLGLSAAETDVVVWLVENHLIMSQISQTRDISDPRTISDFVTKVQSLERLQLLLILTVCDIKAVGEGVWNGWKGQLLRGLYFEAEISLSNGMAGFERSQRISEARAELRQLLPDWSPEKFEAYTARHPAPYWLKTDKATQKQHALLISDAEARGDKFHIATATDSFTGVTELSIYAIDHPRLLAIITGACAAAGANIVGAQIFTTNDGFALDTIMISRAFDRDEDELRRATRVAGYIIDVLKGAVKLPEVVASRAAQSKASTTFSVPPEVMINNALSAKYTVVEVTGLDRPGLLYDLTTEMGIMNLNIVAARIVTYGEKAVDAFYLSDLMGGKIMAENKQADLKQRLLKVLEPVTEPAK